MIQTQDADRPFVVGGRDTGERQAVIPGVLVVRALGP